MKMELAVNGPGPVIQDEKKEKIRKELKYIYSESYESIYTALVLTILIFGLYHYKLMLKNMNGNHNGKTFLLLFIMLSLSFFVIRLTIPGMYGHFSSGLGWGIGTVLIYNILRKNS